MMLSGLLFVCACARGSGRIGVGVGLVLVIVCLFWRGAGFVQFVSQ